MTQTIAPAPAGGAPAPTAGPVVPAAGTATPRRRGRLRAAVSHTPGRMRVAAVIAVLAALAVGVLGLRAGQAQADALASAEADTSQLIGIQEVRNDLVIADASATNAFLVGGLEPPEQRQRYDTSVDAAANGLATLAGSNPADAELLGRATSSLTSYTGLVEQARANNRQGFPVGAAYLDQASSALRTDVLPALDSLVDDNSGRVSGSFDGVTNALWLLALSVLALAVLVGTQVWLARRTHRRLNAGLLSATILLVVAAVGGAFVLGTSSARADDVRDGPFTAGVAVSQALSLANDAKSQESFTLIKRGSGQAYEEAFVTQTTQAAEHLDDPNVDPALGDQLDAWVAAHQEIRALDDGGDWDGAVALAVDPDGAPQTTFDAFSASASAAIDDSATETRDALSGAGGASLLVGWIILVAGILAAALSWRGIGKRVEEYR